MGVGDTARGSPSSLDWAPGGAGGLVEMQKTRVVRELLGANGSWAAGHRSGLRTVLGRSQGLGVCEPPKEGDFPGRQGLSPGGRGLRGLRGAGSEGPALSHPQVTAASASATVSPRGVQCDGGRGKRYLFRRNAFWWLLSLRKLSRGHWWAWGVGAGAEHGPRSTDRTRSMSP